MNGLPENVLKPSKMLGYRIYRLLSLPNPVLNRYVPYRKIVYNPAECLGFVWMPVIYHDE